jgi:hypothetical protein
MVELLIGFVCFCGLSLLNADLRIGKFMKNTNEKRNKIRRKMNPQYPNL